MERGVLLRSNKSSVKYNFSIIPLQRNNVVQGKKDLTLSGFVSQDRKKNFSPLQLALTERSHFTVNVIRHIFLVPSLRPIISKKEDAKRKQLKIEKEIFHSYFEKIKFDVSAIALAKREGKFRLSWFS